MKKNTTTTTKKEILTKFAATGVSRADFAEMVGDAIRFLRDGGIRPTVASVRRSLADDGITVSARK